MDWQLTCRVCLEIGDMVSLFDWDENNEQLGDKYAYCCGIEVSKDDKLPTLICLNCVDRLTYAYEFKQQCLTSNDTLKECLDEYKKTSSAVSNATAEPSSSEQTETITIKQENGLLLQYELPVEQQPPATRTWLETNAVITKAPGPKKRGRPRKYPNQLGQIELSPYHQKKVHKKEPVALTTLLANVKEEPALDNEEFGEDHFGDDGDIVEDPDFNPTEEEEDAIDNKKLHKQLNSITKPRKRGRPRKDKKEHDLKSPKVEDENNGEDFLLKETIMAFSEPIPEHILNPKPKQKKPAKKYVYDKTHVCETCGSSFRSNASLQAHIRRHLGIKPYVCSVCGYSCVLNMELRRHMLRHTGVRPYKCRVCDRRFGDFGSRQKHERLHMGIRPYQCSLCGKSFTYSYVLSNHMLTHTGEKKYSCVPCGKKFTKAHHLKYHNKVHHPKVFAQQQLQAEAKKLSRQVSFDQALQLVHFSAEDNDHDQETQMEIMENANTEENEADEAVANMQGIIIEGDFNEAES